MYNSLVERCFKDCVESFRRKDLDATEEKVRVLHCWQLGVVSWGGTVLQGLCAILPVERPGCH